MIDFDVIDDWAPQLDAVLAPFVSPPARCKLLDASPRYLEDARDILFQVANRDAVIDAAVKWFHSETLAAYHGTRLTEDEVMSVRTEGLLPLNARSRRELRHPPICRRNRDGIETPTDLSAGERPAHGFTDLSVALTRCLWTRPPCVWDRAQREAGRAGMSRQRRAVIGARGCQTLRASA